MRTGVARQRTTPMRVGVVGARGTIGMQAVALLARHPAVSTVVPFASDGVGAAFASLHPALRSVDVGKLRPFDPAGATALDAVVHCGGSVDVRTVIDSTPDQVVIDVGATLRLDPGAGHTRPAATVIPELDRSLLGTHDVFALQGCVPTASLLVLVPLLQAGMLRTGPVFLDAKVGSTGAGVANESYASLHANRSGGVRPFRLLGAHRHVEEMRSYLAGHGLPVPELSLAVFSVDMVRGVSVAVHTRLERGVTTTDVRRLFRSSYDGRGCVSILSLKHGGERLPNPRWLAHTGLAQVGFEVDDTSGLATFVAALDNLMKGGASQAVQVLNAVFGLPDTTGVPLEPRYP